MGDLETIDQKSVNFSLRYPYLEIESLIFDIMKTFISAILILLTTGIYAQKMAFTVQDAINVKSFGSQTLSPNGQYLAGTVADVTARFGTDHSRFRDPSYLNLRVGELTIINTVSGTQIKPFDEAVRVTSLTWSKTGDKLFFFRQQSNELVLNVYDVKSGKVKEVKIKDDRSIAQGSALLTSSIDNKIIIEFRKKGWMDEIMPVYKEATEGPIVVYDGSEPFLKWDKLSMMSSKTEVVEVNTDNGKVRDILPENSYGRFNLSDDGQFLSFNITHRLKTTYNRRDGSEFETGFKDLSSNDSIRTIYERNKRSRNYNWHKAGKYFAWADSGNVYIDNLETISTQEAINLTKDKAFEDEDKKNPVKFSVMRWSDDGGQLLLSSKKGWWTINRDGSDLKIIYELPEGEENEKAPNRNIVKWSQDGRYLYVSYSEKDKWKRGIQRYNIQSKQFEDLMTNANLFSGWRFAETSDKVVYSKSDGNYPNEVYLNDMMFNSEKKLTNLNPWVANKKWTKTELITYRNADGKEMKGILYYPVDYEPGKKYPLVLEVYETFFNNGYRSSMNLMANQGYFGLRPSVDLEQGYPGEAWLKGVTSAINKLVDEGKVDNDKVGIQGTSYGGYATSLIITQTDRFAAAINISGKVNIISFLGDSPKIGTRNYAAAEVGQDRIGGSFWDEPLKYFQTSAVFFADRVKTPHLLLTGEGDWNVPGTNTREMYYALRRLGKDVTWVNYMKGGHGAGWASVESDYHDQWKRIFEFYDKHFNPEKKEKKDKVLETDQRGIDLWFLFASFHDLTRESPKFIVVSLFFHHVILNAAQ